MKILQKFTCAKNIALRIALTYAVISLGWIFFSDQLLLLLTHDPHELTKLQDIKGWFFVLCTALLLFVIIQKEVCKQLLIETLLRKNENRLKETERIAHLGSWELKVPENKLWWSDETYRIFGFKPGDKTSFEKFMQSIHPEDKQNISTLIQQALKQGTPLTLDYRIILPNGDIRYLHEESQSFYDNSLAEVEKRIGSVQDITEQIEMNEERKSLIKKLEKSLDEIKTLKGILPLCSYCKKIRDDNGHWEQVDVYIYKHSQADISHSICPDCMKKNYPEF
ncbi:MAG: PAS domain-containing protein [Desulfurivibrionaceae bacterium]|jgi:PAS domain-containing protein